MVIKRYSLIIFFLPLALLACRPPSPQMEFTLGTMCRVNLYTKGNKQLYSRIFARIREIDRTMTAHPGEFDSLINIGMVDSDSKSAEMFRVAAETLTSGVVAINEQAGIKPVKVRSDLIEVLEMALYYAEISGGAFDPTIGPLVQLWGIGTENQRIPDAEEIANALKLVNWQDVIIDRDAGLVFLQQKGMALDLGAIAKGYAGDEARRIAREAKIKNAIFDLGGDIVTLGWRMESVRGRQTMFSAQKELLPWRIGIQNPLSGRGAYMGVVTVHDMSVATSGVYERYFEKDRKRYHHIFSAADGYPVENGLLSVTIITDSSAAADALATTAFAMGFEQGNALVDSIPNTEAIFIFADLSVRITAGLAGIFTLSDNEFTLVF